MSEKDALPMDAMESALSAQPKAQDGWQSIESAPKDVVLGGVWVDGVFIQQVCHFINMMKEHSRISVGNNAYPPTFFQALPAAPTPPTNSKGE
jgi:hypothetical protein